MLEIANEYLQVKISPAGAELQSIIRKDNQLEYLWSGDPAFWGKKSPVLFPIVGGLKDNTYQYKEQHYQLGRHGFAREMEFSVTEHTATSITFNIQDNDLTLLKYPFPFSLNIRYSVKDATLMVGYEVQNMGDETMYFSIGAHPAFKVPLVNGTTFEDYSLHFSDPETAPLWLLSPAGIVSDQPSPYLNNTTELPLRKSLFYNDALVFKHLASTAISIRSDKTAWFNRAFPRFPLHGHLECKGCRLCLH
jgi:galactose mutarotase-like enzyme